MDPNLFMHLVDCNAEHCWELVRDVVGIQLMGDNVFPTPSLDDAQNYDIGHVILKGRRSRMQKLTGATTGALPVGQLSKFVDNEDNLMQRMGNVNKDKTLDLNQAYEFLQEKTKHGVKKSIIVQLWGCEKCAMEYIPKAGDLMVNLLKRGYVNIDRIFLITEVFYVSEIKIHVVIGDKEDDFQLRGRIPIGFSLVRYNLQNSGLLGDKKNVKVKRWHAKWLCHQFRKPDDKLPFDPFNKMSGTHV